MFSITQEWTDDFGREWTDAWNSHDLDRICSHYAANVQFSSPFVQNLTGDERGMITSLVALRSYFGLALEKFPDLYFQYQFTCAGVSTVTVVYISVKGLTAAETMEFGEDGKITRVLAQYATIPAQ